MIAIYTTAMPLSLAVSYTATCVAMYSGYTYNVLL